LDRSEVEKEAQRDVEGDTGQTRSPGSGAFGECSEKVRVVSLSGNALKSIASRSTYLFESWDVDIVRP